jgi:hypothetical protein
LPPICDIKVEQVGQVVQAIANVRLGRGGNSQGGRRYAIMRSLTTLGSAALLASCASPEARIADALQQRGLDAPRAQCIGARLQRDLSVTQLRQLAAAARTYDAGPGSSGNITAQDLGHIAAQVPDPAVPLALFSAARGCGIGIADLLR